MTTKSRDFTFYRKYRNECEEKGISEFDFNELLYKYRNEHFPFDLYLTAFEFMTVSDLEVVKDDKKRIIYKSKIRDLLVDKLTDMIIKDFKEDNKYFVPLSAWSAFRAYLRPKNDDPLSSMFVSKENSLYIEYIKFAPILLIYLRHGYKKHFDKLTKIFNPPKKVRNKIPKELKGKDLIWMQITDDTWQVKATKVTRISPAEHFWNGLENEEETHDSIRFYYLFETKNKELLK